MDHQILNVTIGILKRAVTVVLLGSLGLLVGCPDQPQGPGPAYPVIVVRHNDVIVQPDELIDINPATLGEDKDLEFLIENMGNGDLKLRRVPPVTLIGSDLSMFSVLEQPDSPIGPGESASFTIRFTPADMRSSSIVVSIGSNDPEQSSCDFTLTRYTEAEISLKKGTAYIPSGAIYDVGTVQLPFSKLTSFLIQNVGTGDLDLKGDPEVSVSGNNAGQFVVSTQPTTPVSPGTSSEFTLVFTPDSHGAKSAVVTIENSDADEGTFSFTVAGLGIVGDVRVTEAPRGPENPAVIWTGTEYGVVWHDWRDENFEIYFTRLDSLGRKLVWDVRITDDPANSRDPSLVWTGTEFGTAWADDRDGSFEIYFARISSSGVKQGQDVRVTSEGSSGYPSLVWTGTEYGVAWVDARDGDPEIYFARISASGVKQGGDVRITETSGDTRSPSLAWAGSEYGVAWMNGHNKPWDIYFARLNSNGVKQGLDVQITDASGSGAKNPSLIWTAAEYGLAWSEGGYEQHEIYFTRISSSGVKQGNSLSITNNSWDSRDPSLAWTGSEYGVAWEDGRWVYNYRDIFFARLSSSGVKQGDNVRITSQEHSWVPSLTWAGAEYGVVWRDTRKGTEIYFAMLDSDGIKQ